MYSLIDLIFTVFTVVSVLLQGYCLQYFLGSFLESRTKSRFHGLYVMAVYGLSRLCIYWLPPTGYESVKTVWKTALLLLLLSLLSILYGVKLFQDTVYLNRERSSRIVLEKQIGSMQEHIAEMERVYSGIRSMKHDMKNTVSVVLQLAAEKGESENEELQTYLSELNQTFDSLDFSFKTGNSVIDTLLNMKYHEALRIAPDLQFDVKKLLLPSDLVIRSYDLGVILGNALDNAMEACRKLKEKEPEAKPFIRLSSVRKDNLLIFKIENSFDGTLKRKGQSGLPETDKADKKVHGIGLANIKNTAGNYQGTMDYKIDGRVFILSVMIKNEKNREMTEDYGRLKNDGSTKPPLEISK